MVKAKDIKLMRKKLTRIDRVGDPLQEFDIPVSLTQDSFGTNADEPVALVYRSGNALEQPLVDDVLDLFQRNMADMYRNSSWGLDLDKKADQVVHRRSRFLLLQRKQNSNDELVGFCQFRFDYDDDEEPTRIVLYVYEMQIDESVQRRGWGRKIMKICEHVAHAAGLDQVMLTVFKANGGAMDFYTKSLMYTIDESSPSQFGEYADYEILVRKLDST